MDQLRWKQFRNLGTFGFLLGGMVSICFGADRFPVLNDSYSAIRAKKPGKRLAAHSIELENQTAHRLKSFGHADDARIELSRNRVPDASIIRVRVEVPKPSSLQATELSAEFGDILLPFYEVKGSKKSQLFEAILGVPYLHPAGHYSVDVSIGAKPYGSVFKMPLEVYPGDYRKEKLRVNGKRVTLSAKNLKRVRKELRKIVPIYKNVTRKKYWRGNFSLPVKSKVTSPFGTKRLFNGQMKSFHKGLDLRAATGTPIRAPAGGIVRLADDLFYTGGTVLLDHGFGIVTIYAHFSQLKVRNGQVVKRGQLLGLAGATGRVSGPHLHWGAVVHKVKINPMELVRYLQ